MSQCVAVAERVHQSDGYPPFIRGSFLSFLESPRAEAAWVAEVDEIIVGHVAVHQTTGIRAMDVASSISGVAKERLRVVARLLVDPCYRGQGIGSNLLRTATDYILTSGFQPMLDVGAAFSPAIRLYESNGWGRVGEVRVQLSDGSALDEIVYVATSS